MEEFCYQVIPAENKRMPEYRLTQPKSGIENMAV